MGSGGDGDPGQWWPLVQDLDRVKETRSYLAPPPPPQQLTSTQIYISLSLLYIAATILHHLRETFYCFNANILVFPL